MFPIHTFRGILADFTPPYPGVILNEIDDVTERQNCSNFTTVEWRHRCIDDTPLPNHRVIVDGPGSRTVFNGHTPITDLEWTRDNNYVSGNHYWNILYISIRKLYFEKYLLAILI